MMLLVEASIYRHQIYFDLAMMLSTEASILPPSADAKKHEATEVAQPMTLLAQESQHRLTQQS